VIHKDLASKVIPWEEALGFRSQLPSKNLVFTNGCFDVLHLGHANYLAMAKDLGDFLWVGINSDASVSKLKGKNRPLNSEMDRALLLAGLSSVGAVTIFSQDTPIELLSLLRPEVHCKGGDYKLESLPETPIVRAYGGQVILLPFVPGKSSTLIIEKAKQN